LSTFGIALVLQSLSPDTSATRGWFSALSSIIKIKVFTIAPTGTFSALDASSADRAVSVSSTI
tara:strand:+ start:13622 stop:13810 length:189 start_codon:yes stop_codon:yes gene_type:complete